MTQWTDQQIEAYLANLPTGTVKAKKPTKEELIEYILQPIARPCFNCFPTLAALVKTSKSHAELSYNARKRRGAITLAEEMACPMGADRDNYEKIALSQRNRPDND